MKDSLCIRIGEWEADPATNELRRGTETVRLEPRSMDLLMALATRAGTVASREDLLAAAWPGVVVGDEALSQGITKLRRALGDDPRSPRYIETISKRGYRLLAPVETGARGKRSRKPIWVAAIVVAIFVAAAVITALWPEKSVPETAADVRQAQWITVTVRPFDSIGGEGDYLARGVSDTLMTELGRLSQLRLIGAGGTAQYVVTGSVQREAGKLRVNVRLADSRSGEQLWSERIERPAGELFEMQDDLVRHLAAALPAKLSESERQRLARRHTRSLEAYDHFLQAQALFLARGASQNEEARALYRKAIELDPRFARAYAGLAMTHAIEHRLRPSDDAARGLERALAYAGTARQIDPDIAEVHWALGFVHAQARRNPADIETRLYLAAAHAASANKTAAEWEAEEVRSLERGFSLQRWLDGYPLASAPHREKLQELLRTAGL